MPDTLIGIDVGTTSVKAILVETGGKVLSQFVRPHPTARPAPGHVEQHPRDWMAGVLAALDGFAQEFDLGGLLGIGICSQVNTHVFVDAAGEPLLPAITWQDRRCAAEAARLDAEVSPADKLAWFGAPIPIDASHALGRMRYVARHYPAAYARTAHVLLPKDFCTLALTGAVASDPVSAIGLVDQHLTYVDELIARVPGAMAKLPPLFDFTHRVGLVRAGLPCAGTPVMVGAMDAWAGMFGVGVVADVAAMYQSGTSEIPGIVAARVVPTPGVVVFPRYRGITLHAAPTQAGGAALAWLCAFIGRTPDEALALAAAADPKAVPLFLPHLGGERAPLWDVQSRGVFARLEAATGPGELARSVLEGVALSVRLAFEALESSAGQRVDVVHLGGGGARSDLWCQMRADALGKTLRRVAIADAGTLGAVIIAGLGAGALASLPEAVAQLVRFDRNFVPDPAQRQYYDDRFGHFRRLYADLKGFNAGFG